MHYKKSPQHRTSDHHHNWCMQRPHRHFLGQRCSLGKSLALPEKRKFLLNMFRILLPQKCQQTYPGHSRCSFPSRGYLNIGPESSQHRMMLLCYPSPFPLCNLHTIFDLFRVETCLVHRIRILFARSNFGIYQAHRQSRLLDLHHFETSPRCSQSKKFFQWQPEIYRKDNSCKKLSLSRLDMFPLHIQDNSLIQWSLHTSPPSRLRKHHCHLLRQLP